MPGASAAVSRWATTATARPVANKPSRTIWPAVTGSPAATSSASTAATDMAADDRKNWTGTAGELQ